MSNKIGKSEGFSFPDHSNPEDLEVESHLREKPSQLPPSFIEKIFSLWKPSTSKIIPSTNTSPTQLSDSSSSENVSLQPQDVTIQDFHSLATSITNVGKELKALPFTIKKPLNSKESLQGHLRLKLEELNEYRKKEGIKETVPELLLGAQKMKLFHGKEYPVTEFEKNLLEFGYLKELNLLQNKINQFQTALNSLFFTTSFQDSPSSIEEHPAVQDLSKQCDVLKKKVKKLEDSGDFASLQKTQEVFASYENALSILKSSLEEAQLSTDPVYNSPLKQQCYWMQEQLKELDRIDSQIQSLENISIDIPPLFKSYIEHSKDIPVIQVYESLQKVVSSFSNKKEAYKLELQTQLQMIQQPISKIWQKMINTLSTLSDSKKEKLFKELKKQKEFELLSIHGKNAFLYNNPQDFSNLLSEDASILCGMLAKCRSI